MQVIPLEIPGPVLIKPDVHRDGRGFFLEAWNRNVFAEAIGHDVEFVQDNHSRSTYRVLRGLHYQLQPQVQGKLVRVAQGRIWDVAVDIRPSSPTFRQWVGAFLRDEDHHQLWVPPGFAHGLVTLSDTADVVYKVSAYYAADLDRAIRWNDPEIGIEWPIDFPPILSAKDANAPYLRDAEVDP